MSTWHQQRARVPLYHASQWTVVSDPPNECTTVARFATLADAETYLSNCKAHGAKHVYILSPSQVNHENRKR